LLNVRSVFKDSKDRIWFGFPNGLLTYLANEDSIVQISKVPDLEKFSIIGITDDPENNLWLITNSGIIKTFFDNKLNCKSFNVYYEEDGLPDNVFRINSICRISTGEIFAGTNKGIAIVPYPFISSEKEIITNLFFTSLKIFNKEIEPLEKHKNRIILFSALTDLKSITLTYRENIFSIEFAALNYFYPMSIRYQYKLEGLDTSWINTNANFRIATFTNLPAGKYTLCLKAISTDEVINKNLQIIILPPFWKSKLAKWIYFILLILVIFLLREIIIRNERKRIAIIKEREEAQRIHNLDMMKINFFTNMSHELRTPLTLIISPLEKLINQINDTSIQQHLYTIKKNAYRLLQIVNQLLDFRKLDAFGLQYNPSMNDIVSFTHDIVLSFSDIAEIKGINYIFNTNIKELVMEFDPDKYEKILYNLLSNAFKYTFEKGTIAIELNFHEEINIHEEKPILFGELILKIKDNGIGITEDMKEKIFDQFVQGKNISSLIEQGTGIGLALVKEYVNIHKGTIEIESTEGKGSCFVVKLPVFKTSNKINKSELTETMVIQKEGIDSELIIQGQKTMLIVEDNEELRFYLKDNFKEKYKIYEAENGQKGLSIAIKVIPDIIITDIMLPLMDGITLCKKIKSNENTSHIPVIILTALSDIDNQVKGIETGADDYIIKPFNFKILEAKINKLVEKQKNKQEVFSNKIVIEPKEIAITSLDEKFMQKALDIVEKNINNPQFTVESLSNEMGMSRMLLYKKILALTGKSPIEFIRTMRMKRAAQLLMKSQLNVSEIAFMVGFNDAKYFSMCFKKEFNMLPSEYKKNYSNNIYSNKNNLNEI